MNQSYRLGGRSTSRASTAICSRIFRSISTVYGGVCSSTSIVCSVICGATWSATVEVSTWRWSSESASFWGSAATKSTPTSSTAAAPNAQMGKCVKSQPDHNQWRRDKTKKIEDLLDAAQKEEVQWQQLEQQCTSLPLDATKDPRNLALINRFKASHDAMLDHLRKAWAIEGELEPNRPELVNDYMEDLMPDGTRRISLWYDLLPADYKPSYRVL